MRANEARLRGWMRLARSALRERDVMPLVLATGGDAGIFAEHAPRLWRERGAPPRALLALDDPDLDETIEKELGRARRETWTLLHPDHPHYPPLVSELAVPPPLLTLRGCAEALRGPAIAFVGSRRCTTYGLSMTGRLAGQVAARGFSVVSGLARGIDGRAHEAALEGGGVTVAVLGTGMDLLYPKEHRRLAERMLEEGAWVTEFPPGTPPLPQNFPRRNRIIAGLADAVVVVEAELPSGSLITAQWALAENRAVLAFPGRVGDPTSAGPLALIREGAALCRGLDDLIAEIRPDRIPCVRLASSEERSSRGPRALDGRAQRIIDALPRHDDIALETLLAKSGLSADEALVALFSLELAGLVEALPGSRYRRRLGSGED